MTDAVWIIVPAYNESATLADVIEALRRTGYKVLAVDDGSSDSTAVTARRLAHATIRHPINLGQGAAIQTGIEFALSRGAEFVVTFDADGQHDPNEVSRLLDALQTERAHFALGSRFLGATSNAPVARLWMLRAAIWLTRLTTGLKLTDVHNGFRAMTRRGAQAIRLRQNRMAHASEILSQIAASGLRYVEVPVTVKYTRYSLAKGQSGGAAFGILLDLVLRRLYR